MVIQPLVEGHGDVDAVRIVLQRLQVVAGQYELGVERPLRRTRSELTTELSVRRSVQLALGTPNLAGILIVFDSDDDPACTIGPKVQAWAQSEAGEIPCQAVAITREYEAWFISALESLRGVRGIRDAAVSHHAPETVRDAKKVLEASMNPGRFYSPRADQAALTARVDLDTVYRRCRSFQKMVKAFGVFAEAAGSPITAWPPPNWV